LTGGAVVGQSLCVRVFRTGLALSALIALFGAACGTIDRGDNIVPPDLALDEDFFYCRIQPEVVTVQTCASGGAGEGGDCHDSRSALRLSPQAEVDPPPTCDGNTVTGGVPQSYMDNYVAAQATVQSDPLSSAFYRRPTGLDGHPRVIFPEGSAEANLIVEWITSGGG
jgi:hypothetical protein